MPSELQNPRRWLADIQHHIRAAQSFAQGSTFETFRSNELVFLGVTRCLEIISEASRRLPSELKEIGIPKSLGRRWLVPETFTVTNMAGSARN